MEEVEDDDYVGVPLPVGQASHWTPEKRLYAAILLDAINTYRRLVRWKRRDSLKATEIMDWVGGRDAVAVPFELLCEHLGCESTAIRRVFTEVQEDQPKRVGRHQIN